ncbi:hypothetical protein IIE18_10275 [Pseudomonas sp. V1]|uniref:hypothetical protein n=1 Tax=Pseudomonas arcuscaelestis TaxID=2710591 RepID=UPI00193F6855|nr:hypothetical protein [Pseudomonas arcuscaelestis]MBM3105525.1 hypothetical protein [Pseudomonas arcuscaelestis]
MIRTLLVIAWPLLIIWAAIRVGYSLQVIDPAKVIVHDKVACEALHLPFDGSCRVSGRMEANLDGTWWIQPRDAGAIHIRLPEGSFPYLYNPNDYHIRGGTPAAVALVAGTVALFLLSPAFAWRSRKRKLDATPTQ